VGGAGRCQSAFGPATQLDGDMSIIRRLDDQNVR